jgi:hypothetical protein
METEYLQDAIKQFTYYRLLGEKTFTQLTDEQLFWQYNAESNSVAIIVKHLHGNMKARWTDFLTTDGEKPWRNRDGEFEGTISTRAELLNRWDEGWNCLFQALSEINKENFDTPVFIRNQEHSILQAVNRQIGHYAYHIGQIVFLGKMLQADNWTSLSIPKGKSADFNAKKMEKGQHKGHFTDDLQ